MPSLTFEGDTHAEIVEKVRRWLASAEVPDRDRLSAVEAVEQGAELTKEALRVIAAAAPAPVADSELLKALTDMGYKATEATKQAILDGLSAVEEVTGGSVVKAARDARRSAVYEMNATIAKQLLKALKGAAG